MDNVSRGHQKPDFCANWQYQWLVDLKQVMFALGRLITNLIGGCGQVAEELNILPQVLVVPLPLIASDLNINI